MSSTYAAPFDRLEEWSGRDRRRRPGLPHHRREAGRPARAVAVHRPRRGRAAAGPGRRRRHRRGHRRPVHRGLAGHPDPRRPRHHPPQRQARRRARPRWTQVAAAFAGRRREPGPGPGHRRGPRRASPRTSATTCWPRPRPSWSTRPPSSAPASWRILGGRVLEHLAPDIADQAEYQRLLAAERRADAATRLHLRPRGDGSTDLHARVPDHAAGRLRTYLNAFTAPSPPPPADQPDPHGRPGRDEFADLPLARQRGIAFVALLETRPDPTCPATAAPPPPSCHHRLRHPGRRRHRAGDRRPPPATDHRRPSPTAGLPGRAHARRPRRQERDPRPRPRVPVFNDAQRIAMDLRDQTCTAIDCTMPAAFSEAHHKYRWSQGGKTDLKDGKLLCPFHHHRAHDPGWTPTTTPTVQPPSLDSRRPQWGESCQRHNAQKERRWHAAGVAYAPGMATLEDVDRIIGQLPGVAEGAHHGQATWSVRGKASPGGARSEGRPRCFGHQASRAEPVLVSAPGPAREGRRARRRHHGVVTIEHFNNYPAVPSSSVSSTSETSVTCWSSLAGGGAAELAEGFDG